MADPASQLVLAPKVRDLFFDSRGQWIPSDYKVMHGGRGGMRTWGFSRVAVMLAARKKRKALRIACAREYQASIDESVHESLVTQISALKLDRYFDIGKRAITSYDGSEFFFAGIKTEPAKFKSTEGIDVLWIEEAEKVSENSWQTVEPTIRNAGSEIWVAFNPDLEKDATSKRFIVDPVPNARIIETNWRDNPWFPEKLLRHKDYLARVDPDAYLHVYEGHFRRNSAAQIFKGKYIVEAFTPDPKDGWQGPYQGADWGLVDPTVLTRCWIKGGRLYVEYEAHGIGVDTRKIPAMFDAIPEARKYVTRGDNARPETISDIRQNGYPRLEPVKKWTGSVEDGIAHIRSYEQVVIHPRCEHTAEEFLLYSFKVDKNTNDILEDIVDKHNHCIDSIRYGLEPMVKRRAAAKVTPLRI